jgi:hypothetical protein
MKGSKRLQPIIGVKRQRSAPVIVASVQEKRGLRQAAREFTDDALNTLAAICKDGQSESGFANRLLIGPNGNNRSAWERQTCKGTSVRTNWPAEACARLQQSSSVAVLRMSSKLVCSSLSLRQLMRCALSPGPVGLGRT